MVSDEPLLRLLLALKSRDYEFTAVTPATHARVLARPCESPGLRDIFGWNRWFTAGDLPAELLHCLEQSGCLERDRTKLRSKLRIGTINGLHFLHSAFPTDEADAVFFGPDTYRFVHFISRALRTLGRDPAWILDMGCGSGAGAITASTIFPRARVTALDINSKALELAAVNASAAQVAVETVAGRAIPQGPDLVIANPPYMMDSARRTYRDGGNLFGGMVALEWVDQALRALAPGGTMLLYTGAAIVNGRSPFVQALEKTCREARANLLIEEIDPDVFGEELDQPPYAPVERIAVLTATILKETAA